MNHQFYTPKPLMFTCKHRAGYIANTLSNFRCLFYVSFRPASDPMVQEEILSCKKIIIKFLKGNFMGIISFRLASHCCLLANTVRVHCEHIICLPLSLLFFF